MGRSWTRLTLEERFVAGLPHLIMMTGVLVTLVNLVGWPLFPRLAYWFLLPYAVLLLVYRKRSAFVWSHLIQAISYHLFGLLLGLTPALVRLMSRVGILGEKWYYTGLGGGGGGEAGLGASGGGATPAWALAVLVMMFGGVFIFSLASDAAIQAFAGKRVEYLGLARLRKRLAA